MNQQEEDIHRMLQEDLKNFRHAGGALAEAATFVATYYDGVHRLSLALAEWNKTIANEGMRGQVYVPPSLSKNERTEVRAAFGAYTGLWVTRDSSEKSSEELLAAIKHAFMAGYDTARAEQKENTQ